MRPIGGERRTNGAVVDSKNRLTIKALFTASGQFLEALRSKARRIEKIIIAEGTRERRLDEIFDLARDAGVGSTSLLAKT
jgi:hypothetical protein